MTAVDHPVRGPGGPPAATPTVPVRPDDDVPGVLTALWADALRGLPTVHVLQLTDPAACDLAVELVLAAELAGDAVGYEDATPDALAPEPDAVSARFPPLPLPASTVVAVRRPRLDGAVVRVLREAEAAVLVVDRTTPRAVRRDAVGKLAGLGVELRGLVSWRGRVPRDPSRMLPARGSR